MKYCVFLLAVMLLIAYPVFSQDVPTLPALLETDSVPGSGATVPVIWMHPDDPALSLVIASDDNAGIAVYDLDGNMLQFVAEPTGISGLDLRYNFPLNGQPTTIVSAVLKDTPQFALYTIDVPSRSLQRLQVFDAPTALRNTCLYRSPISGDYFVFVSSEDGDFGQYLLGTDGTVLNITLMRAFSLDTSIGECVADDELGNLFVAEEPVAIWRYNAEPDADSSRTLVAAVDGNSSQEFEGLALYYAAGGGGYLLASTLTGFNIYERGHNNTYIAAFQLTRTEEADAVEDPNGIDVVNFPLNDTFTEGLFVTADEINTEPNVDNNFKFVAWSTIASQFELPVDITFDPRVARQSQLVNISPADETDPVANYGDAADDIAIWIHPTDPNLSTIIGTDKRPGGGLMVYDLEGNLLQFLDTARMNNIDLRYNFPLAGQPTTIVVATNRDDNGLSVFRINPETRMLEDIDAQTITTQLDRVDGVCMYHSAASGRYYAFVTSPNNGAIEQYELFDNGSGLVEGTLVRQFVVGSQTEGCVADDELGNLFLGEELVGLWRYGAEPDAGEERFLVDSTGEDGHLTSDVEGSAIYYGSNGTGYIIVSSQGSNEYMIYAREGDNAYIGTFRIVDGVSADGVSNTDGVDVTNFALGDLYPHGLFVTQDGENMNPEANQDFKLVSWNDIAESFGLTTDTTHDPRTIGLP